MGTKGEIDVALSEEIREQEVGGEFLPMTREFDTHVGLDDGGTVCLGVSAGQRVRISVGLMEGAEAIVIQQRSPGRVLVRLQQGVYVEIYQYCLENLKEIRKNP